MTGTPPTAECQAFAMAVAAV